MAVNKSSTNLLKLVISILACIGAGVIGSLVTTPAIPTWYAGLTKPVFSPPNWLFAPVWTILFILMGIAAYLVWEKGWKTPRVLSGLILFLLQLIFNILWSVFFFGFRSPLVALIVIIVLWFLILFTSIEFYRVKKAAAYLMIPYLAWVTFASVLNTAILMLNP